MLTQPPLPKTGNPIHLLDQAMHLVWLAWVGEDGRVPSRGVYKIRQGLQRPWRTIYRRLRDGCRARVEPKSVLKPLRVLEAEVREEMIRNVRI